MFKRIMVPVDLAHAPRLGTALQCAADLAKLYDVPLTYVGITAATPSSVAHNPTEFEQKLKAFAQSEATKHGIDAVAHTAIVHDPTIQIEATLRRMIDETDADLVVMASHIPNVMDHFWPSNGGKLAEHAKCSVMIVRA